jgi:hypothetical protein
LGGGRRTPFDNLPWPLLGKEGDLSANWFAE